MAIFGGRKVRERAVHSYSDSDIEENDVQRHERLGLLCCDRFGIWANFPSSELYDVVDFYY